MSRQSASFPDGSSGPIPQPPGLITEPAAPIPQPPGLFLEPMAPPEVTTASVEHHPQPEPSAHLCTCGKVREACVRNEVRAFWSAVSDHAG
jgi:hypothetical protein